MGLLHGKMKNQEKDDIMQEFKRQSAAIIGFLPPIVISWRECTKCHGDVNYGCGPVWRLAQLHQLRGRVGRGSVLLIVF